ncbi:MAG: NADH-quinone oxidoreductase subunit N [Vicinamibacterales bacterium]|jgi:NADH-quinone oxidoreductase subunit N|nr:NADH-quinone oxidoreductase subunit N [Acidobacteriota bacterium]MDP7340625.1 NADH-quinone oxidoreductase subunit N [Vicinamibacterales bacterium]MDP7479494.1 NADH-quinone oxidoreductase subunit N [Vicinamibacterales bacterium]MDP7671135.1 NADH-quinone oxidoreductase subunit N [Vicinamibacterales bacterium]HJO39925.1 NADH-quinone oxidoreductase subunit N [Vicinamibacterales bacterium]|tara:strand:+ start:15950 stop:17428 length:1479 start_codon:yes stop_codon:yes gene_type:complete
MPAGFSAADFYNILPELVLTGGALLVLIVDVLTARQQRGLLAWVTLGVLVATLLALLPFSDVNTVASRGLLAIDGFAFFFKLVFLLTALVTVLMSSSYIEVEGLRAGEYYFLILCATLGMMFMASGIDLITIFIGLETMAVAFYILAGFLKPNRRSNEAAVKYFLLGAFSLGLLLYGMSILYGLSGTTNVRELATVLASQERNALLIVGLVMVVAGIGFKIAAVPFHMWAPDVYEGAPTPVTAFLSVGSKAASFAMLLRLFMEGLPFLADMWQPMFWVLAVMSMTVGNLAALTQSNIKRMLAYSSIAHAGYLLIGVVANSSRGVTAMMIYLLLYVFMQLGAFAVVVMLRRQDVAGDELKDLSGLYFRYPTAAVAMLFFMLSLGGLPPTAGFMGKFWLFSAAIESGFIWLAVIGVLNSAVSLYYYIRVVVFMWMKEEALGSPIVASPSMAVALTVALAGAVVFGVYPRPLFELAQESAQSIGGVAAAVSALSF